VRRGGRVGRLDISRKCYEIVCVRGRGRRGEREDARGGGPPGYPKALPLYLVERKKKGKKGEGVVGTERGSHARFIQYRRLVSADAQSKERTDPLCILCWGNNGYFHKRQSKNLPS